MNIELKSVVEGLETLKSIPYNEDKGSLTMENKDIKQYSFLYRYYPNFAETLL